MNWHPVEVSEFNLRTPRDSVGAFPSQSSSVVTSANRKRVSQVHSSGSKHNGSRIKRQIKLVRNEVPFFR